MTEIPATAIRETWETVFEKSVALAAMIESDSQAAGECFDAMIVVPRGSYYPANIVSRELGFSAVDLLHACIGSYKNDSSTRQAGFELGQMPTREQVAGKKLLIVEEVCDTGHTLKYLTDWLAEQGAAVVRTGVLHYKPGRNETDFVPDWFVTKTDEWVSYPWEIHDQRGANSKVKAIH